MCCCMPLALREGDRPGERYCYEACLLLSSSPCFIQNKRTIKIQAVLGAGPWIILKEVDSCGSDSHRFFIISFLFYVWCDLTFLVFHFRVSSPYLWCIIASWECLIRMYCYIRRRASAGGWAPAAPPGARVLQRPRRRVADARAPGPPAQRRAGHTRCPPAQ
jgi:hypothetical protein